MAKKPSRKAPPAPQPRPCEEDGAPGRRPRVTHNDFILICERYAETGLAIASCEELGFNHSTVMGAVRDQLNHGDSSWQDLWDYSLEKFRESLSKAIVQRGRDGTPTKWKVDPKTGERTAVEFVYSDRMLELAAKAYNPQMFRDHVAPAGALGIETVDIFSDLTPKAKREIRAIIIRDLEEQRVAAKEGTEVVDAEYTDVPAGELEDKRGEEDDG